MEIKLKFRITCINEEVTEQEIATPVPPEVPVDQARMVLMMKMMNQYAQVGLLRQPEPDHYILMCPSQIAFVECELPSIVLASPLDVPKTTGGGIIAG